MGVGVVLLVIGEIIYLSACVCLRHQNSATLKLTALTAVQ